MGWEQALIIASWPQQSGRIQAAEDVIGNFTTIKDITTAIRNIRTERNVQPGTRMAAHFDAGEYALMLEDTREILCSLAGIDQEQLFIEEHLDEKPGGSIPVVVGGIEIFLPLEGMLDVKEETERLEAQLSEVQDQIERLEQLLAGPFAERAPEDVVKKEREKLEAYRETAQKLKIQLTDLHE
jgi:valyl-tRNA synthetase